MIDKKNILFQILDFPLKYLHYFFLMINIYKKSQKKY